MLSKKEKMEFVRDGLSSQRRMNFRKAGSLPAGRKMTLDNYIHFLMQLQRLSQFKVSRKGVLTAFNKL